MKRVRKLLFCIMAVTLMAVPSAGTLLPNASLTAEARSASRKTVKLTINKEKASMLTGSRMRLKLNIKASKAKWKSSSRRIASVSSGGVVRAKRAGTAVISARYKRKTVYCAIQVVASPDITIRTVDFDLNANVLHLLIQNTSASPVILYPLLEAYDSNYDYCGKLKLPSGSPVTVAPNGNTIVTYRSDEADLVLLEAQRLVFFISLNGQNRTCYGEYTDRGSKPFLFSMDQPLTL